MKVLVVGGGGREHALAWALAGWGADVFCAPGNPGTAELAENVPIGSDPAALAAAIREHRIALAVIGPEAPLAAGLVDSLAAAGIPAFGPTASAARIEASKAFAKELMAAAGVRTAASRTFTDCEEALRYVAAHRPPLVVKASGLAAGKGAVVCESRAAAESAVTDMMEGRFGDAGRTIVIEDFLEGEELSVFALTDGEHVLLLPAAQDHKRLQEGDRGPNTGGMGAYAPVTIATPTLLERVTDEVLRPTLRELARRGSPYRGVLYAGLMTDRSGAPSVVEFNCRFGDPEAQVVLPAIERNLLQDLWRIAAGEPWTPEDDLVPAVRAVVTTVLASPGYPDAPRKGLAIALPDQIPSNTLLFHAGTQRAADGGLVTAGGRVFACTGLGGTVAEAAEHSRALARQVSFEGKVYRTDIAWREVARAGAA